MAWEDRISGAAYTSPGGTRLTFDYEDVSTAASKRTTVFQFPNVDGAYVQDNGHGARAFPLRCFFSGDDHDTEASAFEVALLERGVGRLEHPFYGTFDVVPLGEITRRDDLKTAANQSIIQVRFSTTLAAVYPQAQTDLASDVLVALVALEEAGAQQFEDSVDLSTVAAKETLKTTTGNLLTAINAALASAAAADTDTADAFADALASIGQSLDVLVLDPAELARQLFELVAIPASGSAEIEVRLDGYAALADVVGTSSAATPADAFQLGSLILPGLLRVVANDFHAAALVLDSAVAGTVRSVVETQFTARPGALAAADVVLVEFDAAVVVLDAGYAALSANDAPGGIDTGEAYQALQDAVALAAGFLVEISFTLLAERRIVLDRPRTILDLAAELYGSVSDAQLDILIDTNDLSGSEILELPRLREVVYYA